MILLAIDPGPVESALVVYDGHVPVDWMKRPNEQIRAALGATSDALAIEMIASYGMAVGAEVFSTCVWIGRFAECWERWHGCPPRYVFRRDVKLHICHDSRAKDANVRQALIDRFGPGKELAIGKKASPGPLYGMAGDCWAALGVAITAAETAA